MPQTKVVVDLSREFQTIHSFGASDCWSAKFVGEWEDETKKNHIADLLFSQDTLTNGQPKGIGLSLWRMNIGAGSYEQGEASDIKDPWRREECFQDAKGQYDWTKQAGSQWFLRAAKQRGVRYTLGFSISPPVHMTVNGKAFSPGGGSLNLKPGLMPAFADFLTKVSEHFGFDYLSPLNEPQWDWKAGKNGKANQEGTPAQNSEILDVARALSKTLSTQNVNTTVVNGETAQLNFLYERAESGRGDQMKQLYTGSNSLHDLPKVENILAFHSYFTTCDDANLVNTRRAAIQAAKSVDSPELWQSEFGILGNICDQYNGYPRNTGIDYGLYVAKVIHNDLTITNVSSWQWWLAINPYDYSDGLVYINGPDGQFKNHDNARMSGNVVESKQLWSFGNFSRFVRPGMKRVNVQLKDHPDPIAQAGTYMVSAYKEEASRKIVFIGVNMTEQAVALPLSGLSLKNQTFTTYTTSREKNLAKDTLSGNTLQMEPKSVTTFVGHYN
ncbi:xylanase [Persicitalea jodogahamensis]|uniref:Xylanase n=1 Tax=Persicitalea jodogahamensis TaxID=402147 RepID=A0A8J3GAU2_9BACT|nr:xylanase [Persicitalea jodogahamensis]